MEFLGALSFSHAVMEADIKGTSPYLYAKETVEEVRTLKNKIEERILS
jgi:hypothetical protein